jgi:hypothetical protein
MRLIATKRLTYNTRHLVAGDPFDASNKDARILIGIKKAKAAEERPRRYRVPASAAAEPTPAVAAETVTMVPDDDEITRLRKTARRLGIVVDKRWGSQTLRDRIAAVRGS